MYTILVICNDLKKIKFDLWKGSLVQQIIRKMLVVCLLIGISAWCIVPSRSLKTGQLLEQKEVEQEKQKIKRVIERNKKNYLPYIKSLAYQWSWYKSLGWPAKIAAQVRYTKSELKYADAAGPFFENQARVEKEARAIGTQKYDIDYMHNLIKYYKQQDSNEKDLPRILHEKNIEHLSLPRNVTQSTLKKYPDKLSALVKTGQINAPRYYRNVALNIFLRFLIEKKLLPQRVFIKAN